MLTFAFVSGGWVAKGELELELAPMHRHHVCLGRLSEFPALEVSLSPHFVSQVGVLASYSFTWVPPHLWLSRPRIWVILKSETCSGKRIPRSFHRYVNRVQP